MTARVAGGARWMRLMLAVALSLAAVVAALALPSATLAQASARKSTCSGAAAHPRRSGRGCVRSTGKVKSSARRGTRHHRVKHAVKKKRAAARPGAAAATTPASCEDASVPVRAQDGTFSCADGGEPTCEDRLSPAPSSNGSRLLCPAAAGGSSGAGETTCEGAASSGCSFDTGGGWASSAEPACEDGSTPIEARDGSFSCDDGSEPGCEDGSSPTPSSDGSTLLCESATSDERRG